MSPEILPAQPPPDTTIWRYMDLPKFLSLIHNRALFFPQFKSSDDSYEGSMTWITPEDTGEPLSMRSDFYKYVRENSFGSCWHANDGENTAMWKLYLSNNQGIAIKTNVGNLTDSLSWDEYSRYITKIVAGMVTYRDNRIDPSSDTNDHVTDTMTLFCKKKSFEHEKEYRIVIEATPRISEKISNGGISVPINLETLKMALYMAPTAPTWIQPLLESILETKYQLNIPVRQSSLDEKPLW